MALFEQDQGAAVAISRDTRLLAVVITVAVFLAMPVFIAFQPAKLLLKVP